MAMFYDSTLLFEEGNKCFEFVKSYEFEHEQQFALQDDWNEGVMYQKQCHVAMKDGKPVKGNAKCETQTMNASFEKKTNFDFKVSLFEKTIPSNSNIWNLWIGNRNSGMDAVAQANGIDETQLSKGHRKQQQKNWNIETTWNLIQGMEENTQLNVNGKPQDEPLWLSEFRDNQSVTRTEMCSLKVPTTASWSNGSCKGPAALFKTMWTHNGTFGKSEVSDNLPEPGRNIDEQKLGFCGERSSKTLHKRNSIAWQLLEENLDVGTNNDVSVSKELNVVK